jgi:hypothetical protein
MLDDAHAASPLAAVPANVEAVSQFLVRLRRADFEHAQWRVTRPYGRLS